MPSANSQLGESFGGRVALVTGGASGIGESVAELFAARGAAVAVLDVQDELGERVCSRLEDAGAEAKFHHCDVTDPIAVDRAVEKIVQRWGRLDCAVNNAGFEGYFHEVHEYPVDGWTHVLARNLTSVFLCMRCEIAQMRAQSFGSIVNTASMLGTVAYPTTAGYTASKFGVIGLTKTAALELAPHGIRVNAVCPGFVETPMVTERGMKASRGTEAYAELERAEPMQRMAQPKEIAEAVIWLCSDASSFVTGHPLLVDGGYVSR
jgi:NAD(P)-dependent dehydrogenase (short-subunit alcohol dehydrogenase family)